MKDNDDFDLFKGYFLRYCKLLGLNGYRIYFKYEPTRDSFAEISVNQTTMCATVWLNSKVPVKDKPFNDIRVSAKHEALHLLTYRLEALARYRYATEQEIFEASEELAHKLEPLLRDDIENE